jgi:hypothetical protein
MRTDGSDRQRVSKDRASNINVNNGWIYYDNLDDDYAIYRIRTDGIGRSKITERLYRISVLGDWIFYDSGEDEEGFYIALISTDGSERKKIYK